LGPNTGVFPLEQTRHVGVAKSEHPMLTNGEIIFEEFQPMWSQFTKRHRQTDRRIDSQTTMTCDRNTALYGRRFLQVCWPNQQCQSTEGGWLVIQTGLNLTMLTSPCYNNTTCMQIQYKTRKRSWRCQTRATRKHAKIGPIRRWNKLQFKKTL